MILEGLVTTRAESGGPHLAPMGPRVAPDFARFTLKPFATSTTYQNLKRHPEGVFHVTDDVLLIARAAVGKAVPFPDCVRAEVIRGARLADCCRAFEFRVIDVDDSRERVELQCEVVHVTRVRDFFGFNRAKHAVIEAAVLATRLHLLPADEIEVEFARLQIPVAKTGGEREVAAFTFLDDYRRQYNGGGA